MAEGGSGSADSAAEEPGHEVQRECAERAVVGGDIGGDATAGIRSEREEV